MLQIVMCREKSTGLLYEVHINSNGSNLKVSCRRWIDKQEQLEELLKSDINNLDDRFTVLYSKNES